MEDQQRPVEPQLPDYLQYKAMAEVVQAHQTFGDQLQFAIGKMQSQNNMQGRQVMQFCAEIFNTMAIWQSAFQHDIVAYIQNLWKAHVDLVGNSEVVEGIAADDSAGICAELGDVTAALETLETVLASDKKLTKANRTDLASKAQNARQAIDRVFEAVNELTLSEEEVSAMFAFEDEDEDEDNQVDIDADAIAAAAEPQLDDAVAAATVMAEPEPEEEPLNIA